MLDYTVTVNGVNLTGDIRFDSYSTSKTPIYSDAVTTMDGVTHVRMLRNAGSVSFALNPRNAARMSVIANALLAQPCMVYYWSLQTQQYELVQMRLSDQNAEYLARCKFLGEKWSQMSNIELTEL